MTDHNLFYFPYASFTNAHVLLLKVAALWFDDLVILDPVGAGWDSIGVEHAAARMRFDGFCTEFQPSSLKLDAYYFAPDGCEI